MSGSRSLPLLIVCIVLGLRGLFGFFQGATLFALSGQIGAAATALGLLVVVFSFVQLIAVGGLWSVRSWGWTFGVAILGLDLVFGVVLMALTPTSPVIAMAMDVVLLGLLAIVKRDFGSSVEREEIVPDQVH